MRTAPPLPPEPSTDANFIGFCFENHGDGETTACSPRHKSGWSSSIHQKDHNTTTMMARYCLWLGIGSTLVTTLASAFVIPTPLTNSRYHDHHHYFHLTTLQATSDDSNNNKRVVVIGNGMVGQRFMEKLLSLDETKQCQIASFCEEPRAAYNRVKLTSYFETRNPSALSMTGDFNDHGTTAWYEESNVKLYVNDKATSIDTTSKIITGASGVQVRYDICVMATGSYPFVPPIPGRNRPGVFVYRTIEDLENMLSYAQINNVKAAAVIGGGLLGLEAAKAAADMGLGGHAALVGKIESMGLKVHCGARTSALVGLDGTEDNESMAPVAAVRFSNDSWEDLPVQMVIVSAGIKPRDELAKDPSAAGTIQVGERGGIVVNEFMQTSDPNVYAIGEIALYQNFIYGLIAPGYTMANVAAMSVAAQLGLIHNAPLPTFTGADMSTKLKLLGCDVASFGENQPRDQNISELVWNDPIWGIYRKLIFDKAGKRLRGGILVGDASDYDSLHRLAVGVGKDQDVADPASLLPPPSARGATAVVAEPTVVSDGPMTQICSCNDVTRGDIAKTIIELGKEKATLSAVKKCSRAGTGCGGCEPQVKNILKQELEKLGGKLSNSLCEHFAMSRPELMAKVRLDAEPESVNSFEKILAKHGSGDGCEICKPAVASILASLYNDVIVDDDRLALQDTNDRSLANMQRGGTYSVVPRVPAGELLPTQLIKMGEVAQKYNLYTKITGAQRIDLFGASRHELPDIWEELGSVGLESGHAYGKALRTVKSCVGSTWCRYGVQDSVSFAVRVENRYKGIRSPHKLKSAVSGCVRECAEAQGKDFGMIATENGYNLYLGGNGGANPVHAELFATDIDEDTVLKYLDRYLMYYILTADRLERTAPWQRKLPSGKNGGGPIEHLKEVIIEDSLGICEELDKRMAHLVETYHDEWVRYLSQLHLSISLTQCGQQAEVVKDPVRRAKFKQFVNTDDLVDKDSMIEFVDMRGQLRPADWPKDGEPQTNWRAPPSDIFAKSEKSWICVGKESDFPANVGSQILYGESQLAVFNNKKRGEWYCTQNMCPHKQAFVLSQGIIGDSSGTPKVACPLHKKQFGLDSGEELNGGDLHILTFPVDIRDGKVFVELPSIPELDAILGTNGLRVKATSCIDIAGDAIKVKTKAFERTLEAGQRLVETATRLKETALKAKGTNSTEAE